MTGGHIATLLVVFLLHFCSPDLNALAPSDGIDATRGLAYASGARRGLDVYAPRPTAETAPVVVFFYGGGWETGTKEMYRFVGAALAERGVVAVIPDYRLHPEVRFPAFVHDAAASIAWTRANIARFGGDPHRLFLMGHSAGGQIVTLLALDPRYLRPLGLSPKRDFCGVIGLAGAYDFTPERPSEYAAIFGPERDWRESRPINFVTKQAPPMLLLTGGLDGTVEPGNTLRFAERLRATGVPVRNIVYPGLNHFALVAAFSRPLQFLAPVVEDAVAFISARGSCGG